MDYQPGDTIYASELRKGMMICTFYDPRKRRELEQRGIEIAPREVLTDYQDTGPARGMYRVRYQNGVEGEVKALASARYTLANPPK